MDLSEVKQHLDQLSSSLTDVQLLFVVPPFVKANRPSYGVHLLQAICEQANIKTGVLYSNLALYALIGESDYDKLTIGSGLHPLVGDLVFRELAYGSLNFDKTKLTDKQALHKRLAYSKPKSNQDPLINRIQPHLSMWLDVIAQAVVKSAPKIVGLTSTFDQNNASIALINAIKKSNPQIITLIGGANCEDEMAQGIESLNCSVDYIFSGESDATLVPNLNKLLEGKLLSNKIIKSAPVMNLDESPSPIYDDFFQQFNLFAQQREPMEISLPYETSRGCWWGQKHHCTFCGLNGDGMTFRFKSANKITTELEKIKQNYNVRKIQMVDNIMPMNYFKDLLPELTQANLDLEIFYEQKANLDVKRLVALKHAGISVIQPGIESFSSNLLKMMDKGVSGSQNLLLLRNAKSLGIGLAWNLLYAFPGDELGDYEPTRQILSKLVHLQPPVGFFHLSLDRFSLYQKNPVEYGINNIKPLSAYDDIYPPWANKEKLAYYFEGDYQSGIEDTPELVQAIDLGVRHWQDAWRTSMRPFFHLRKLSEKTLMLIDNRENTASPETTLLTHDEAYALAMPCTHDHRDADINSFIQKNWGIHWDDRYIPLMTMDSELLNAWN